MQSERLLDAPNPIVRAIERWKRGFAALFIVLLAGGTYAFVAAVPVLVVMELAGAKGWTELVLFLAALIVAPWTVGQRRVLRTMGDLGKISDE